MLAKPSTTEFFLDVTKNHLLLPNSQGISECKATLGVNKMFCCLVACVRQRIENLVPCDKLDLIPSDFALSCFTTEPERL